MAALYINEQLIATSDHHGVVGSNLLDGEYIISYTNKKTKYYTLLIFDDNDVHSLIINIRGDDLETGQELVDFLPFQARSFNYDVTIVIYEQPKKLSLPGDDFDMERYIVDQHLVMIYKIEFTVLLKYEKRPNVYSTRSFNQKLKLYKNKS